ncbi:VOC family protein [Brachybacterium sp. YJGR34]|uniref:VOC family protein n=1 Tax=Brachybacterium sp. YJGR34 TaxID=2059911 RepID=UPI000E09FA2A|nr:VOC family protein [Brachybacterium sp. YJGR34]
MSIRSITLNVRDIATSRAFYEKYLAAQVLEETAEYALLDVVTATIRLRKVNGSEFSSWQADDLRRGFRHIGFKVADTDRLFADVEADGVPVHLAPLDAEGGVRIAFFYDPDGTLLEFVQGDLHYHHVADQELVDAEYALGVPERPRFDHIAETVENFESTQTFYDRLGFRHHGSIVQASDPRGFQIRFLKNDDSVLEIFTYEATTSPTRQVQDAPGFADVVLSGAEVWPPPGAATDDDGAVADPDGLALRSELS